MQLFHEDRSKLMFHIVQRRICPSCGYVELTSLSLSRGRLLSPSQVATSGARVSGYSGKRRRPAPILAS